MAESELIERGNALQWSSEPPPRPFVRLSGDLEHLTVDWAAVEEISQDIRQRPLGYHLDTAEFMVMVLWLLRRDHGLSIGEDEG